MKIIKRVALCPFAFAGVLKLCFLICLCVVVYPWKTSPVCVLAKLVRLDIVAKAVSFFLFSFLFFSQSYRLIRVFILLNYK